MHLFNSKLFGLNLNRIIRSNFGSRHLRTRVLDSRFLWCQKSLSLILVLHLWQKSTRNQYFWSNGRTATRTGITRTLPWRHTSWQNKNSLPFISKTSSWIFSPLLPTFYINQIWSAWADMWVAKLKHAGCILYHP